jgi:hypothetical protein
VETAVGEGGDGFAGARDRHDLENHARRRSTQFSHVSAAANATRYAMARTAAAQGFGAGRASGWGGRQRGSPIRTRARPWPDRRRRRGYGAWLARSTLSRPAALPTACRA